MAGFGGRAVLGGSDSDWGKGKLEATLWWSLIGMSAGGGWCRSDQWSEEVNEGEEPGAEGLFAGRQTEGKKVNIQVEEGRAAMGTVTWGKQ